MKFGIGHALRRKEDNALLRGQGCYVADHGASHVLHAVVVRSPHAHAGFSINAESARTRPGVQLVLTGADVVDVGPIPCLAGIPGVEIDTPHYPVLARDVVRHVGDAVAFVVADTREQALDAGEAITLNWNPRPHIVGAVEALAADAPQVWSHQAGNLAFDMHLGDRPRTERLFADAGRVVSLTLVNQRVVANYLDTRGVTAEFDDASDLLTLTIGSQGSHSIRDTLCQMLSLEPQQVRVVTNDVGGGFGTKLFFYREYALAAFAAGHLKRNVRWMCDRTEHFVADTHGRDNITTAKLALDANNKFLGLDIDLVADMGAYLSEYAPYIPYLGAGMSPGVYDIDACHVRVRGVYTHTVPVDAYRGAGRPEASYVIERLVDAAARELDVDPVTLRKRNFIKPNAMPYKTATGKTYDTGDFAAHMSHAQGLADWSGFKTRAAASRRKGLLRGIGMAVYIEACGNAGPEQATLAMDRDGVITLFIGSQSSGQGHDTSYAQIVSENLGISPDKVRMVQGDTARIATGGGTGGSSSIPCGGVSVGGAARKLGEVLKRLAADALETAVDDLEFGDDAVQVVGTDRRISFADLARRPDATPERLKADDTWTPGAPTFPNGTHVVEVEIDPATGAVSFVNYVIVDDFGVTLNPMMLAGQVHGGAVQGIGQALSEHAVYDTTSGQLLSASLMDYALPRASDVPSFEFDTRNVPCLVNPLGVKGAGEAGAIGSCPAVMNAIVDALWRAHEIRHLDMPATPARIWAALQEGKRLHTM